MPAFLLRRGLLTTAILSSLFLVASAQTPVTLPSESPAIFNSTGNGFDYDRREVMIPMRDGIKLNTLILIPRGVQHAPILLTRTPYGATDRISSPT